LNVTCEYVRLFIVVAADINSGQLDDELSVTESIGKWVISRTMCIKYSICFIVFGSSSSSFYVIVCHAKQNYLDLQLPNRDCVQYNSHQSDTEIINSTHYLYESSASLGESHRV